MADRVYFEQGKWPLVAGDEITHHNFEDLRMQIYLLRFNLIANKYDRPYFDETLEYNPPSEYTGEHPLDLQHMPFEYMISWKGYFFTNYSRQAEGEWGDVDHYHPDNLCHYPPDITKINLFECSLSLWDSTKRITKTGEFGLYGVAESVYVSGTNIVSGEYEITNVTDDYIDIAGLVCTGDNTGETTVREVNPQCSSTYWILTVDLAKYHDFDKNSPRRYLQCKYEGTDPNEPHDPILMYRTMGFGYQYLPPQFDPKEQTHPLIFSDSERIKWTYGSKVNFKPFDITNPHAMSAVFACNWICIPNPSAPEYNQYYAKANPWGYSTPSSGNQYSTGDAGGALPKDLPDIAIEYAPEESGEEPNVRFRDYNPKAGDLNNRSSYQQHIELACDGTALRYPANSTYIANWALKNPTLSWAGNTQLIDRYPPISTRPQVGNNATLNPDCWGNNGSGFEFCKELSGEWDWFYDRTFPYISFNHLVSHYLATGDPEDPENEYYYPYPVGTWRKIWKHSMGRPICDGTQGTVEDEPKGLLRACEDGDPRSGNNYPGDTAGITFGFNTYSVFYPPNCFVAPGNEPDITMFTNWSYAVEEINPEGTTAFSFTVAGDCTTDAHEGALIYLCLSNALGDVGLVYVVRATYNEEDDRTTVEVTSDIAAFRGQTVTVKGDNRLSHRHDPVQIRWDDVANGWKYQYELTAALVNEMHSAMYHWTYLTGSPTLEARFATHSITPAASQIHYGSAGDALGYCQGEMHLDHGNPDYWLVENNSATEEYGVPEGGLSCGTGLGCYNHYDYGVEKWTIEIDGSPNGTSVYTAVALRCTGVPEWYTGNTVIISIHRHPSVGVTTYEQISLSTDGSWAVFHPPMAAAVCTVDYPIPDSGGQRETEYAGSVEAGFAIELEDMAISLDFNQVPETRFTKDTIAAFEFEHAPVETDANPPQPNPAIWQKDPRAYFLFKPQIDKTQATFTVSAGTGYNTLTVVGRTFANGDIVSVFNVKVSGVGDLPEGLAASNIYKVIAVSGLTFKLALADDETNTEIDITDAGTGTQYIEEAGHFELRIVATVNLGWDEEGSDPIKYRVVGVPGTGAPDSEWSTNREVDFLVRRLSVYEALQGFPLRGASTRAAFVNQTYNYSTNLWPNQWLGTRFLPTVSPIGGAFELAVGDKVTVTNLLTLMPEGSMIMALWGIDEPICDGMNTGDNYLTSAENKIVSSFPVFADVEVGDMVYITGEHVTAGLYEVATVDVNHLYITIDSGTPVGHANGYCAVGMGGIMVFTTYYPEILDVEMALEGKTLATGHHVAFRFDMANDDLEDIVCVPSSSTDYHSSTAARAAIPAVGAGRIALATINVYNGSGSNFITGTTSLSTSGVTCTYFAETTPRTSVKKSYLTSAKVMLYSIGMAVIETMNPSKNWLVKVGESVGYGATEFAEEGIAAYKFRPQSKDTWAENHGGSSDNEGYLGDERTVAAPLKYPYKVWTDYWGALPPWGG